MFAKLKLFLPIIFILIIAAVLRFWSLGSNPPSLTWDEAAWGYNAYSLGVDGKDEFGRFLPHDYLESFGDFKPPVYAYLDVVPVKLLGLNNFSTRFPSALLGLLTVLSTFLLVIRLFPKAKHFTLFGLSFSLAEIAALFLAISPWHIMLSRAAFEANVATFFIVTGVWLFLLAVQKNMWALTLSAVCFVLSIYTFNSARIVSPILVTVLALGFYKTLLQYKKEVVIAAVVGLLLFLPTFKFLLSPQAGLRFAEVNIFTNADVVTMSNQESANNNNDVLSKIIYNRRVAYSFEYLKHYFDNVSPAFLFGSGDANPKFSIQDVGQMYVWDLPFFIIGILFLFKKREGAWWIIPLWLLVGIIPAAAARETPHALRTEATLPTFQIFAALGFYQFLIWAQTFNKKKKMLQLVVPTIVVLLIVNVVYFLHSYVVHYANDYSPQWQYGFSQSIEYAGSVSNKYNHIYFSHELGRPYIYVLFYTKYDPKMFRATAAVQRDTFGFVHVNGFGKYTFSSNMAADFAKNKTELFIDVVNNQAEVVSKLPKGAKIQKIIPQVNGSPALIIYSS